LELSAERDRVFDPARRAERVAERDAQTDTVCSDAAPPLRAKQTAPVVSVSDSESEATDCGYDTDTELAGIDDDDESTTDGEPALPTFSMVRTLHESVDVVRVAVFPPPPRRGISRTDSGGLECSDASDSRVAERVTRFV